MRWLKSGMSEDRPMIGTFCCLGSVDAVELACHTGFDFVVVDGQHGSFGGGGMGEAIRAADAAGCMAIARIPANGFESVERLLDLGYTALMVPMVNRADQAARAVEAAYYAPVGQRSASGCRAMLDPDEDYRSVFNDRFALIVMIEHVDAVARADEILSVPGVSAGFVGPTDLASSLREAGQGDLDDAIATALAAGKAAGKPMGIAARSMADARRHAEQGFRFVAVGTDRRLLQTALGDLGAREWARASGETGSDA